MMTQHTLFASACSGKEILFLCLMNLRAKDWMIKVELGTLNGIAERDDCRYQSIKFFQVLTTSKKVESVFSLLGL